MSATGGRPAAAVVMPVGTSWAAPGSVMERTACMTGVMLWVVKAQLSTTLSRGMPAAAATARCELVNWRSGSSAQAVDAGNSGSVLWPLAHSAEGRLARK